MLGLSRRGFRGKRGAGLLEGERPSLQVTHLENLHPQSTTEVRAREVERVDLGSWLGLVGELAPAVLERALQFVDDRLDREGVPNRLADIVPRFPYITEREKDRLIAEGYVVKPLPGPVSLMVVAVDKDNFVWNPYYIRSKWIARMAYRLVKAKEMGIANIPVIGGSDRFPIFTPSQVVRDLLRGKGIYLWYVETVVHEVMHFYNATDVEEIYDISLLYRAFAEVSSCLAVESLGFPSSFRGEPPVEPRGILRSLIARYEEVDEHEVTFPDEYMRVNAPLRYAIEGQEKELPWDWVSSWLRRYYGHATFVLNPRETARYWTYWESVIDRLRVLGLRDPTIAQTIAHMARQGRIVWDNKIEGVQAVEEFISGLRGENRITEEDFIERLREYKEALYSQGERTVDIISGALREFAVTIGPREVPSNRVVLRGREGEVRSFVTTLDYFARRFGVRSVLNFPPHSIVEFELWRGEDGTKTILEVLVPPSSDVFGASSRYSEGGLGKREEGKEISVYRVELPPALQQQLTNYLNGLAREKL